MLHVCDLAEEDPEQDDDPDVLLVDADLLSSLLTPTLRQSSNNNKNEPDELMTSKTMALDADVLMLDEDVKPACDKEAPAVVASSPQVVCQFDNVRPKYEAFVVLEDHLQGPTSDEDDAGACSDASGGSNSSAGTFACALKANQNSPVTSSSAIGGGGGCGNTSDTGSIDPQSCWLQWDSSDGGAFDCKDLPNASALEIRRQKNRDSMRRSRQRQKEKLNQMKATLAALERQYDTLCREGPTMNMCTSTATCSSPRSCRCRSLQDNMTEAAEAARRLGAENLFLKAILQEQAQWKQHIHRVLESPTAAEIEHSNQMEEHEALVAQGSFCFKPLAETKVHDVITESSHSIQEIHEHLLPPSASTSSMSASSTTSSPCVPLQAMDETFSVLGWDAHRHFEGTDLEFVYSKEFHDVSILEIMQQTWAEDVTPSEVPHGEGDQQRLDVLQQVNDHAVVLGRDVHQADVHRVLRSIQLRFRMETMSLPSSEFASGYIIGSQSLNPVDEPKPRFSLLLESPDEELAWADSTFWIEFLTFADDPAHCQVRWTGKTKCTSMAEASRSSSESLMALLRWEEHTIAPAVTLAA